VSWESYVVAVEERDGFVAALVSSPVGAALLGLLEGTARDDVRCWEVPSDSRPDAVAAAVDAVATWVIGRLLELARAPGG